MTDIFASIQLSDREGWEVRMVWLEQAQSGRLAHRSVPVQYTQTIACSMMQLRSIGGQAGMASQAVRRVSCLWGGSAEIV